MAHAAEHLAAGGLHRGSSIGFKRMPEGIINGDEEPAITAFGDGGFGKAGSQRVTVIDPGRLIRRTVLARKSGAADRARYRDAVKLRGELLDRERNGGMVETDGEVDAFAFEPAARDCDSDISLVLMIGHHDFDRL